MVEAAAAGTAGAVAGEAAVAAGGAAAARLAGAVEVAAAAEAAEAVATVARGAAEVAAAAEAAGAVAGGAAETGATAGGHDLLALDPSSACKSVSGLNITPGMRMRGTQFCQLTGSVPVLVAAA